MAVRSGCPAGLAGGSVGGRRPSVCLSVRGDTMAPVGSEGLGPASCRLCRGRSIY